jgi:hypothetical protein
LLAGAKQTSRPYASPQAYGRDYIVLRMLKYYPNRLSQLKPKLAVLGRDFVVCGQAIVPFWDVELKWCQKRELACSRRVAP